MNILYRTSIFLITSLALALLFATNVFAEGSKELNNQSGYRPFIYLDYGTDPSAFLNTEHFVYVNEGDTLQLGSSLYGEFLGDIYYIKPDGSYSSCLTDESIGGLIANRAQEVAGPLPSVGGYTPCEITVGAGEGGLWKVYFTRIPTIAGSQSPILSNDNWVQLNFNNLAAWDITVRNASNNIVTGRAFANFLDLDVFDFDLPVDFSVYFLVKGGYIYEYDLNGLMPYIYTLFANNVGVQDAATGAPLYGSYPQSNTTVTYHEPTDPDTATIFTHKIFFNEPSSDLPISATSAEGLTWLLEPQQVPQVSNIQFFGVENTANQAGRSPMGGNIVFDSTTAGSYEVIIDINNDGIFGNANDRILRNLVSMGQNSVYWDGRDQNGVALPVGTANYSIEVTLYAGELHFLMIDVETNYNGIIVNHINNPNGPSTTVYFDDTPVGGSSALNGVDSSTGAHAWGDFEGDVNIMDTWTYIATSSLIHTAQVVILEADTAVSMTNSVVPVCYLPTQRGISFVVQFRNNGPSTNDNVALSIVVPNTIENVTWDAEVLSGNVSLSSTSGTDLAINEIVTLEPGDVVEYRFSGLLSATSFSDSVVTAAIGRELDSFDPNTTNNAASVIFTGICRPEQLLADTGMSRELIGGIVIMGLFTSLAGFIYIRYFKNGEQSVSWKKIKNIQAESKAR